MRHPIFGDILEMLNEDMVSHGLLLQSLGQVEDRNQSPSENERELLTELLASEKVEVGVARLSKSDYVEFIAWKGTVDERVRRAMQAVDDAVKNDKEFAFWLCLSNKVDRFEGEVV